jgi:methionyl aminopeptidase
VARGFTGHGIGRKLHEQPAVPNHGQPGAGLKLRPGMVLAVEPMVNQGTDEVDVLEDDWTAVTADGKLSAHFEHTVLVTDHGPEVLTRA